MENISNETIDEEKINRLLKNEVDRALEQQKKLTSIIQELEDKNMELICESVQVDWNLYYDQDELPEDYWPEERIQKWDVVEPTHLPPLPVWREKKPKTITIHQIGETCNKMIDIELNGIQSDIKHIGINGQSMPINPGLLDSAGQKYYH